VPPVSKCVVCDTVLRHSLARYCTTCKNILGRVESRGKADNAVREKALKNAWDKESECFRCHYSGIPLVDNNPDDPRYVTFDHLIPRKEGELVVAAAIICDMKSNMSEDEFRDIVCQLAKHFENGTQIDETVFKVKHYRR
jgi:hypothetical protein